MKRKVWATVGIVALGCYVAVGLSRIRFDVDITRLLPEDMKEAEGARLFLDHYSRKGELLVTLEASDDKEAEDAVESLAAAFREEEGLVGSVVSQPAWETEKGGEEMLEFIAWVLLNRPPAEMEALERSLGPDVVGAKLDDSLERLASGISPEELARLEYDPLGFLEGGITEVAGSFGGASEFASADGRFRVLYVGAKNPEGSYREKIAWIGRMREVVSRWEKARADAGEEVLEIGFTGEPAFVAEISGGMERDMRSSAGFTLVVTGLIFWIAYRRFRPLVDLVATLLVIFLLTLATGGILFRELSAISIGFASILIGLTVDYGVILYQNARFGGGGVAEVRRATGKGILWAAVTTAGAFGSLAAGTIPGLSELGILVGVGVVIGAAVMYGVFVYRAVAAGEGISGGLEVVAEPGVPGRGWPAWSAWVTSAGIAGLWLVLLISGAPEMDSSSASLRPRDSQSQEAMDRFVERLGSSEGAVSVIVSGRDLAEAGERLEVVEGRLRELSEAGVVEGIGLPTGLWPYPEKQRENLEGACGRMVAARERLLQAVGAAGFEETAFGFAGAILDHWSKWRESGKYPVWPESDSASRAVSRIIDWRPEGGEGDGGGVWGVGLISPAEPGNREHVGKLRESMDLEGVYISGGNVLSSALAEVVPASILRIFAVLCVLVMIALAFAFRRPLEIVLTLISVVVTMGALLGAMRIFGISWNFMNLAALLLALGAGLDYAIHILIDLRRHGGCVKAVRGGVGMALLVCGLSSIAGFGSLAWAGNLGLASLGQTCALALVINTAAAVFVLPTVWNLAGGGIRNAS